MKNRKSFHFVIIFALVLFLSVGYAVVNSVTLTVTGSSTAATEDLEVYFDGTTSVSSSKVTATATNGTTSASILVNDLTLNETVTATYTVVNNETDVGASYLVNNINLSNSEYFSVTTDASSNKYLLPKKTNTVTVTVKMIKTPITEADNSATFNITINAEPVDLISFYVDGTEYYAKSGMTWAEWMSSYGYASGFGSNSTEVTYATSYVTDNYVTVKPTDVIKSGYTYNLVQD